MKKIEQIPIDFNVTEVKQKLRVNDRMEIENLVDTAKSLISARAVYRICYVEEKSEDAVVTNGTRLRSRVLRKNLDKVERLFPYVITIGANLEKKAEECKNLLQRYCLDMIGNMALGKVRKYVENQIRSRFALKGLSYMSPGSLADWPIEEQRPLFTILDGAAALLGVNLNENFIMNPRKSVSGIYFPTETTFISCQLCPRENCIGRKAKYSEELCRQYELIK
jgi:hypothetical protein